MPDDNDGGHHRFHNIPSLDGHPSTWSRYKEAVHIWTLSENLDVKFSMAARLISRSSGAARRCCINMPKSELMPVRGQDAEYDADGVVVTAAADEDLEAGINNVMERLHTQLQPEPLISRGEALTAFFKGNTYYRRPGMRMTEFVALFEEGLRASG